MICNDICFLGKHNVSNNEFVFHKHNCYEVIYFLKGKGTAVIGGRNLEIAPGKYCIVPPNVAHVEQLGNDGEILFVGFVTDRELPWEEGQLYEDTKMEVLPRLEAVFQEFRSQKASYKEAACALVQLFLIDFLRQSKKETKECKDLCYVKSYLEQYYGQKINFRELSGLTGYSYDYFRHIFKQTYGLSPQDYLVSVRLERAKQLLKNTKLSCTQIASCCGFSNGAQMSAMIKREFDMTPSGIRKSRLI